MFMLGFVRHCLERFLNFIIALGATTETKKFRKNIVIAQQLNITKVRVKIYKDRQHFITNELMFCKLITITHHGGLLDEKSSARIKSPQDNSIEIFLRLGFELLSNLNEHLK